MSEAKHVHKAKSNKSLLTAHNYRHRHRRRDIYAIEFIFKLN